MTKKKEEVEEAISGIKGELVEMNVSPETEWHGDTFILKLHCKNIPRKLGPAKRTMLMLTLAPKVLRNMVEELNKEENWTIIDDAGEIQDGPPSTH